LLLLLLYCDKDIQYKMKFGNPINGGPKFLYHVKHGLSSRVSRVRVRVSVRFSIRYKNLGPPFIGLPEVLTSQTPDGDHCQAVVDVTVRV